MNDANSSPKIMIEVVSTTRDFLKVEHIWNTLVDKSCTSPFLLSGFVKQWMEYDRSSEWTPLLLMFSINGNVIGFVPLVTSTKFGIRSAKFLHKFVYQPDFIVINQHRKIFIETLLCFLLRNQNCKFIDFSLDANSPNLCIIEQYCMCKKVNCLVTQEMGRNIIPIKISWTKFKTSRGKSFRRRFNRIQRNFDRAGSWKIVCKQGNNFDDAIKKIFDVEKRSWKEKWRIQMGEKTDQDLQLLLEGAQNTANIVPDFNWKAYFLELNGYTIAYFLVFLYKEVAFLLKTSYDERYKNLSPGSFLRYCVIHKIFESEKVKCIDFVTDLPHHLRWGSVCVPRTRTTIVSGTLSILWKKAFDSPPLSKVMFLVKSCLTIARKI